MNLFTWMDWLLIHFYMFTCIKKPIKQQQHQVMSDKWGLSNPFVFQWQHAKDTKFKSQKRYFWQISKDMWVHYPW